MRVSLVAAVGRRGQLGLGGRLPWRVPGDLANFRRLTLGRHVAMGRGTLGSLPRPLPGRTTVVLSRDPSFAPPGGVLVARSAGEALRLAEAGGSPELVVAGGAAIYALFLPLCHGMRLSRIDYDGEADAWFPPFDPGAWEVAERREFPREGPAPAWALEVLERRGPPPEAPETGLDAGGRPR